MAYVPFQSCTTPAPITTDEAACVERERIDYSIKITLDMARAGKGMPWENITSMA